MRGACTRDDKFTSDKSSNLCSCNTLTTNQSWALYLQLPSWIPTRDVCSPAKVVQLKVSVRLSALCLPKVNPLLEGPCCHIFPKSVLFSSSDYCVLIIMVTRGITCSHALIRVFHSFCRTEVACSRQRFLPGCGRYCHQLQQSSPLWQLSLEDTSLMSGEEVKL